MIFDSFAGRALRKDKHFWINFPVGGGKFRARRNLMLGIPDVWIVTAYLSCLAAAGLCVGYGLKNWNTGSENEMQQVVEEEMWQKSENEMDEKM